MKQNNYESILNLYEERGEIKDGYIESTFGSSRNKSSRVYPEAEFVGYDAKKKMNKFKCPYCDVYLVGGHGNKKCPVCRRNIYIPEVEE